MRKNLSPSRKALNGKIQAPLFPPSHHPPPPLLVSPAGGLLAHSVPLILSVEPGLERKPTLDVGEDSEALLFLLQEWQVPLE